jgi:hypothetical protein
LGHAANIAAAVALTGKSERPSERVELQLEDTYDLWSGVYLRTKRIIAWTAGAQRTDQAQHKSIVGKAHPMEAQFISGTMSQKLETNAWRLNKLNLDLIGVT